MGGAQDNTDQSLIDGFYVYFAPYGEPRNEYLQHHVVFGSSVRHAVLTGLDVDTAYSIRMQSFRQTSGVLSKLSNAVVQHTLGTLALSAESSLLNLWFNPFSPTLYLTVAKMSLPKRSALCWSNRVAFLIV